MQDANVPAPTPSPMAHMAVTVGPLKMEVPAVVRGHVVAMRGTVPVEWALVPMEPSK